MKSKILLLLSALATLVAVVSSCQSEEELTFKRYYSAGALIYRSRCQNCHAEKGDGLGGLIPPLTDSLYLKTNKHQLACYIGNGLKGPIRVNGKIYFGAMPAQTGFTPVDIAEVLTYVTNSFGNKLGVIETGQVNGDLAGCK